VIVIVSEMAATATTSDIRTPWKFVRAGLRQPASVRDAFIGDST